MTDPLFLIPAAAILVLGGFVKGVIGLGLPTISIGLLGLMMAPVEAAALLVLPNLVTNIWQAAGGGQVAALARRLWPLLAGIGAGTFALQGLVPVDGFPGAARLLGAALALYGVLGLFAAPLRLADGLRLAGGIAAGAATGALTLVTGIFVIPAVPYLQALGLAKDDLVQALGLSFLTSTIAFGLALSWDGRFDLGLAGWSLAALLPVATGMLAGRAFRARLPPALFRRAFLASLTLLGLYLLVR